MDANASDPRWRLGQVLGALPGVVLHLLGSAAGWTFVQVNGLMVAGCGATRRCDFTLIDSAVNAVQPVLIVVWVVTTVFAFVRPLVRGRNPWPVLGVGIGASALITAAAYVALRVGAGSF